MLTNVLLPVASLTLGFCTWYLTHKRGWNKILPIFNLYIAFYCISTVLLLGLYYCSLYPGSVRTTICLLSAYSTSSVQIVTGVFVLAVLYELLSFTGRNRAEIPVRVIGILGMIIVAAAFALAILGTAASGATNYCLRLAYLASAFWKAVQLIGPVLLIAMIVVKWLRKLRCGRGVLLIFIGLAQFFVANLALSVAVYNGHLGRVFDIVVQISLFSWWLLWWLAVRKGPDDFATQPRAAAVPVN